MLAIVGARDHGNRGQVDALVDEVPPGVVVVSGGARGVDTWAVERARARGLQTIEIPVPPGGWERFGRIAGHLRNAELVAAVDEIWACPWWGARGTGDTIARARAAEVPLRIEKPVTRLRVFTARLRRDLVDPDLLDVTRGFADRHRVSEEWTRLRPAERERRRLESVRLIRRHVGIYATQRRCFETGMPPLGDPWAPPMRLLGPALGARRRAQALVAAGDEGGADEVERVAWERYAPAFTEYLRETYRSRAAAWGWLLAEERVVLACACVDPERCHRSLVARALQACGATWGGEIENLSPSW